MIRIDRRLSPRGDYGGAVGAVRLSGRKTLSRPYVGPLREGADMSSEATTAPRIRFATHDGLPVFGGDWDHYLFHWEAISATGRTFRGDYKQGTGIGWQLDADTARATILRELGEPGALRTDGDIADWLDGMGVDDPGEAIRLLRAVEGMRRFYDRCTVGERAALDAFAAGDWDEDTCDECGCQMDTGDDRVCDACESGERSG